MEYPLFFWFQQKQITILIAAVKGSIREMKIGSPSLKSNHKIKNKGSIKGT
jgi:hypothetical protein